VSGVRPGARRAIGLSLLVQSLLLLIVPSSMAVEVKAQLARSAQKRITPGHARTGTPEQPDRCVHVVRRGDSLARLAALYRTTRRAIIAANAWMIRKRLRAGQRLQISGCPPASAHRHDEPDVISVVDGAVTELLARVGPLRVPTRLFLAVPDFDREVATFQWPIEGPVASGFGRRHQGWHAGIDIQAEIGTPIRAAARGTVIMSGWERYYGRMIKIQHPGGFTSLYAHNYENMVEVGDEVEAGSVIGTVGRSGHASGAHLHLEIRQDGVAYNPLHLLERRETPLLASPTTAMVLDDEERE
jgi:murein DD-endopeptidase MepM/ murein hydrolase activator NlpD